MISTSQRKALIETASGKQKLDLAIDNLQVVDVYTGQIEPGAMGLKMAGLSAPTPSIWVLASGSMAKVAMLCRGSSTRMSILILRCWRRSTWLS